MTAQCLMECAKSLGLPLLPVAVSALAVVVSVASVCVVFVFSWWQVRIAREKLRHDLYDRRFAIYMAFHELMVAILEKDEVDTELRKANAARAHSPFLLDAKRCVYLQELHKEAFSINATNKLIRDPNFLAALPPIERAQKGSQLGSDKLNFANKVAELAQEFKSFLKLKDFSKPDKRRNSA